MLGSLRIEIVEANQVRIDARQIETDFARRLRKLHLRPGRRRQPFDFRCWRRVQRVINEVELIGVLSVLFAMMVGAMPGREARQTDSLALPLGALVTLPFSGTSVIQSQFLLNGAKSGASMCCHRGLRS